MDNVTNYYESMLMILLFYNRFGESETPASLMLLSSLVTLIDESFDLIGKSILASWKLILLLVFGLVSSYYIVAVIAFEPLIEKFYYWITPATYMIDCFHSIQFSHLLLIFIGYMSAVYFLWTSNRALIFQVPDSFNILYIYLANKFSHQTALEPIKRSNILYERLCLL